MTWERVARDHDVLPKTVDHVWWQQYLTERPDVMYRLLGDLYQASATVRGKDPNKVPTVDELRGLVTQKYSNDPFGVALKELLGDRSVRWLAHQMKIHHSQITRIIRGERDISTLQDPAGAIEAVARVLRVHPSYFVEWRRMWIMNLLDDAFTAQPHLSIGVGKKFSAHEPRR